MGTIATHTAVVKISTPAPAYHWALLERELLRAQATACAAFYAHYFDERGYLLCVPRWGGDDGPDDAAENLLNWTMLHALGADDIVLELYKKGWEGHLRQYTEARTVEVPMAREGMYYKEFPVVFDWFHHGEGYSAFTLQGLSDPYDPALITRMRRFSGFYMGEDPQAPNWDPQHRIIRSMMNGSRGPMLRKATGLDWAGDPIEVQGRFRLGHGEASYEQIVEHFKDYNDVAGDHPLNMGATAMAFNAYALTGEEKYRAWLLDYVDAWVERTAANGGIIPSNIGLDGTIGGECGGKWWGGVYGWGFSVMDPATKQIAHRPYYSRAPYGFGNALLLTGDRRYIDVWRGVIDHVNENARVIDGRTMYPYSFGNLAAGNLAAGNLAAGNLAAGDPAAGGEGWYNWKPEPFHAGALEVYYWSMDPADRPRVPQDDWLDYLDGDAPDYPVRALSQDLEAVRYRMELMRQDTATPDTRLSDDMNHINPAVTETLTQLMLGGLPTGRAGYQLHARVRYFDPARRRAGLPEDVAALVEGMTADEATLHLVNLNPVHARRVIVQGGAYAEHRIESVACGQETREVGAPWFAVELAPGAGARLRLSMSRYACSPTLAFPWG